jgi:DNA-binding response OmpR family regulator
VHILLVDDDAELSALLTEYLGAEGFETSVVHHGEAGVEAALSGQYDAVILDVMLPRLNGIEALRRIRQHSRIPIIMLTAKGDNIDRVVGLEMGADDYVPKPCYPRELVARLRAVLRRSSDGAKPAASSDTVLREGKLILSPAQRDVTWDGRKIDLTVSEFNMLELLLRAGDVVVSKDELSERALGRAREAYDRSVDVHMSNLRQKLSQAAGEGMQGEGVQIATVRGIGYRLTRQVSDV